MALTITIDLRKHTEYCQMNLLTQSLSLLHSEVDEADYVDIVLLFSLFIHCYVLRISENCREKHWIHSNEPTNLVKILNVYSYLSQQIQLYI